MTDIRCFLPFKRNLLRLLRIENCLKKMLAELMCRFSKYISKQLLVYLGDIKVTAYL